MVKRVHDNNDAKPACMILPQMIKYTKYFDSNKIMCFMASDKRLLKTYNKIWEKVQ